MNEERKRPSILLRPRWLTGVFWLAVFCATLFLFNELWCHRLVDLESETAAYLVLGPILFASLPAAIASLFGRWWIGVLVGLGLFSAYVAFILAMLSLYPI